MSRSRVGTPGLLLRHTSTGVTGSLLVALLVAIAVFATAVAPRALMTLGTDELQHRLGQLSPSLRDLTGLGRIGVVSGLSDPDVEELLGPTDHAIHQAASLLPSPLADLVGEPRWVARSAQQDAFLPADAPAARVRLKLAVDLAWRDGIRIVSGEAPAAWAGSDSGAALDAEGAHAPLDIAISETSADAMNIAVGDLLSYGALTLRVAATYAPTDPHAAYWAHAPDLADPSVSAPDGVVPTVTTSAYVDPGSVQGLLNTFAAGALSAWIPIDPSTISYADAAEIATQTRARTATLFTLPAAGELNFSSRFADAIDQTGARVVAASALLALSLSGLLGVLLAVLTLGIGAIVERRRAALVLIGPRGASGLQLRGAMALEGLLVAVPAAVVGGAAAVMLVPEPVDASAWVLPVLVALSVPVVFAGRAGTHGPRPPRRDLRSRGGRMRLIAEALLVGAAALALFLLSRRGLAASAGAVGIDPLLALTPVLLAAAVCALALRLYPLPLRFVLDRLRNSDSAVGLVGAARAVRAPVHGPTASFALVLGVTVVVFSSVLGTTLSVGVTHAAAAEAGADIKVRAVEIAPDTLATIADLDGVRAASALTRIPGAQLDDDGGTSGVTLVLTDTAALHAIRPELPQLDAQQGGRIPIAVSDDVPLIGGEARLGSADVAVAGRIPAQILPGVTRDWVLADAKYAAELGRGTAVAEVLLIAVTHPDDPDAVAAVAASAERTVVDALSEQARSTVTVTTAQGVLDDVRSSPVIAGIEGALPIATGAALLLTLLALALATLAAGSARSHLVGVLRVIGGNRRQQRGILVWESAPVVIVSILVGVGLGLALPYVVTAAVDLRAFVGGDIAPSPVVDPLAVTLAVLTVLLTAVLAGAAALALGRRLTPAVTLKMGER
jgi:putative ABC transport system permease protein